MPKTAELSYFFRIEKKLPLFSNFDLSNLGSGRSNCQTPSRFVHFLSLSKFFNQISQCQNHRNCYNFLELKTKLPLFSTFVISKLRFGRLNCQTSNRVAHFLPLSKLFNQFSQWRTHRSCYNFLELKKISTVQQFWSL